MQAAEDIRELMQAFDTYRAKWIETFGSDRGFSEWFTQQVNGACVIGHYSDPHDCQQYPHGCKACYEED